MSFAETLFLRKNPELPAPLITVPGGAIVVTGRRRQDVTRASSQVVSVLDSASIARTGEGDIAGAVKLAAEVQAVVLAKRLRPAVRTHYMRTAFQKDGDATVRCSLDTELCMALEPCEHYEWKRSAPLSSASQLTLFPHAVLEVKLQLASGAAHAHPLSEPPRHALCARRPPCLCLASTG